MGGGRLSPATARVEASESANGAEDGGCGRLLYIFDLFEDLLDNDGDFFAAQFEEAVCGGMAVENVVSDPVGVGYLARMAPFDEVGFDEFAFGVIADFAFAAVAFSG